MSIHLPDYIRATIDGNDRTDYIISYSRHASMCELGDSFTLEVDNTYPGSIDPYASISLTEHYNGHTGNVLKGYITDITLDSDRGSYDLKGSDKSIRLFDYFISTQITSNGESADYWIEYLAGLAGLSVTFNVTSPAIVPQGTALGLQTAADAILSLERLASYYIKYSASSDSLEVFRPDTTEAVMTVDEALKVTRKLNTDNTRNVVKVYGGFKFNLLDNTNTQIFANARIDVPELISDKTIVVANPSLTKQTYVNIVASRILNVVGSVDDVQSYDLAGFYPSTKVGDVANIDWDKKFDYHAMRTISSLSTKVDADGAVTQLTFGEKCPRLSISFPPSPVYAGTLDGGVGVSYNAGDSFIPTNLGLSNQALNVRSVAVNSYGQQMIVTGDGLYKRNYEGATWLPVASLPDPNDDAGTGSPPTASGLTLIKVVDEPTKYGTFHVLTKDSADAESYWIYTTKDLGNSWTNFQAYTPSGILPTRDYEVVVSDMEASLNGNVYHVVSNAGAIEIAVTRSIYYTEGGSNNYSGGYIEREDGVVHDTLHQSWLSGAQTGVWSYYINDIAYICAVEETNASFGGQYHRCVIHKTRDRGETWTKIYDDYLMPAIYPTRQNMKTGFQFGFDASTLGIAKIVIIYPMNLDDSGSKDYNWRIYARTVYDYAEGSGYTYDGESYIDYDVRDLDNLPLDGDPHNPGLTSVLNYIFPMIEKGVKKNLQSYQMNGGNTLLSFFGWSMSHRNNSSQDYYGQVGAIIAGYVYDFNSGTISKAWDYSYITTSLDYHDIGWWTSIHTQAAYDYTLYHGISIYSTNTARGEIALRANDHTIYFAKNNTATEGFNGGKFSVYEKAGVPYGSVLGTAMGAGKVNGVNYEFYTNGTVSALVDNVSANVSFHEWATWPASAFIYCVWWYGTGQSLYKTSVYDGHHLERVEGWSDIEHPVSIVPKSIAFRG